MIIFEWKYEIFVYKNWIKRGKNMKKIVVVGEGKIGEKIEDIIE